MADFFTPAQAAALAAKTVRCTLVVKFDFASGTVYAWNGDTNLDVGGNTYLPMHGAASINGLSMNGGLQSSAVTMAVSGLPTEDYLAMALAETADATQQMVTISLVLFDDAWQVASVPIPLFYGFMQPPKVTRTPMQDGVGGTQIVTITAENILFNRSRPPNGRYTDRDQQGRSPGDRFFGFVSSLTSKTITYPDY